MNPVYNVESLGNNQLVFRTFSPCFAYLVSVPAIIPSTHGNRHSDGLPSTITIFIFELA